MKTGIKSSAYFHLYDYAEGFKAVRAHGYDAVDYQEFISMGSPLYAMDDGQFKAFLTGVADAAAENGVEIHQLHAIWPTAGDDTEEGRQKSLQYYRRSIYGARLLGCRRVVVHPRLPHGWGNGGTREEFFEANVCLLKQLMPTAREYGVYVCLENLPFRKGQPFSTLEEWLDVLNAVDDEYAKACLDTGHLNVMEEDPYASVLALGKHLGALHVHDNRARVDMHLLPYQGTLDWDGLLRGLKEIGFNGCFTLETEIAARTPDCVREPLQKALSALAREMADRIGD